MIQSFCSLTSCLVEETIETIIQRAIKGVGTIDMTNNELPNIPLQERDEQVKKVVTIVGNNMNNMSGSQAAQGAITGKAKTDLVIPTFTGGSGIGKVTNIEKPFL